jgi:hypothetical protein
MASYNIGLSVICDVKKQKNQLRSLVVSSEIVKGLFKGQTLKQQPKLGQMDSMFYKWFTEMCSEGKPMTGPMIFEKAKSFCGGMQITDRCTFSDGWLHNFEKLVSEGDIQMEYSSD